MDMDRERTPHFPTSSSTPTDLFICFSSMKLSKSILSPARRDPPPLTLSSSLTRRLRTNGSLKGQASPFITTGKKRGFENPEPSSPKVTCIGQVRVKTKKKVKQQQQRRSMSRREVSFRKIDVNEEHRDCTNGGSGHYQECLAVPPHRNQRWVHLPVSICEAVRAFGTEVSCLFPCKSGGNSCFGTGERDGKNGGAVFARWLVDGDGEGVKKREIEMVVEEERRVSMRSSRRRHVFDDIEVKDDRVEVKGVVGAVEEVGGRASICVPPKNALLLMRCRSDPNKIAALASNGSSNFKWDVDDDDDKSGNDVIKEESLEEVIEEDEIVVVGGGGEGVLEMEVGEEGIQEIRAVAEEELRIDDSQEGVVDGEEEEEEVESNMSSFEALLDQEIAKPEPCYEDCSHLQLQHDDEGHTEEEGAEIQRNEAEDGVQMQSNQLAPSLEQEEAKTEEGENHKEEGEEETTATPIETENEETVNNQEEEESHSNPQFND